MVSQSLELSVTDVVSGSTDAFATLPRRRALEERFYRLRALRVCDRGFRTAPILQPGVACEACRRVGGAKRKHRTGHTYNVIVRWAGARALRNIHTMSWWGSPNGSAYRCHMQVRIPAAQAAVGIIGTGIMLLSGVALRAQRWPSTFRRRPSVTPHLRSARTVEEVPPFRYLFTVEPYIPAAPVAILFAVCSLSR